MLDGDRTMNADGYVRKAGSYLDALCSIAPGRSAGSPGNLAATDFFARTVGAWGYAVETAPFPCLDFRVGASSLACKGRSYDVYASPFSPGCDVTAGLVKVSTLGDLEKRACRGEILFMDGALCVEHLMPKNHPFYNLDRHRRIYVLLEEKRPAAIVTATGKNPALMGALYPYPLIEDGDFDIPSAYCTETTGKRIASETGSIFRLMVDAERISSTATNVIARKNPGARHKIVVCAHIDARAAIPGALDNASGTVVLLLLAEMLADYRGEAGIEIVAISGEDHYSAGGEVDYLDRHGKDLDTIALAINIDGVGYVRGKTAFSFYGCDGAIERQARAAFRAGGMAEGDPWYAGDHMVFVQCGTPAIALTSEHATELIAEVIHTPRDAPDLVDCRKLVEAASALSRLITGLTALK